jgi:hypothetical protein
VVEVVVVTVLVVVAVLVVAVVVPVLGELPRTAFTALVTAGYHLAAILVSPELFGWMPSRKSDEVIPSYWSTTQIGDWVLFCEAAQAGIALFKAWTCVL